MKSQELKKKQANKPSYNRNNQNMQGNNAAEWNNNDRRQSNLAVTEVDLKIW